MDRRNKDELNRRRMDREEFSKNKRPAGAPAHHSARQKIVAEHTVAKDETLSHIALKYYGSAVKEKWMKIYEANKDVIGDDPSHVSPGQVLKIPELPE